MSARSPRLPSPASLSFLHLHDDRPARSFMGAWTAPLHEWREHRALMKKLEGLDPYQLDDIGVNATAFARGELQLINRGQPS